jgi:hypothetical protein
MFVNIEDSLSLKGLARQIEHEGDRVTGDLDSSQLTIKAAQLLPRQQLPRQHGGQLNRQLDGTKATHFVTRYWDGRRFLTQCFLGIPLLGHMNHGLGCDVAVGLVGRYINIEHKLSVGFNEDDYDKFPPGFISQIYADNDLLGVQTSVPFYGLYAILEGRRGKISELFSKHQETLESWVVGLLVTRSPWPHVSDCPTYQISDVTSKFEKHFWFFSNAGFRRTVSLNTTVIGVATAWHRESLELACDLATQTAWKIEHPEKQFRTDLWQASRQAWIGLKDRVVV